MAVTQDKPAPYAPAKTILDIITRYRDRGLTSPINAEVLSRIGVAESLISRTLQALVTLDLFDDAGNPTQTLEGIRIAPEAEYKKRLEDWLKGSYADVSSSSIPPSTTKPGSGMPFAAINRRANSPAWSAYSRGCAPRPTSSPRMGSQRHRLHHRHHHVGIGFSSLRLARCRHRSRRPNREIRLACRRRCLACCRACRPTGTAGPWKNAKNS